MERGDLLKLLEARLWVGRLGESDVQGWWRTDGVLGSDGAFVGPRVLPRTHFTGRARIVFAVARHACGERHPDPQAQHLFKLDPVTEDQLDALLVERLGEHDWWQDMMSRLEAVQARSDPANALLEALVVAEEDLSAVGDVRLGPDRRSLPVPNDRSLPQMIGRLSAGFTRSEPRSLVVPYLAKAR